MTRRKKNLSALSPTCEGELPAAGAHEVVGGEAGGGGHLVLDVGISVQGVVRAPLDEDAEVFAVVVEKLAME